LGDRNFELLITDEASVVYERLRAVAENSVPCDRFLPVNGDPRLSAQIAAVQHYDRTRNILRSIVNPRDVGMDMSLLGVRSFVKYRTQGGTCVYFTRMDSGRVMVYHFSDSPLDISALQKVIVSGLAHKILPNLGLPLPNMSPVSLTIH
jgi:hypothetical protein